MRRGELHTGHDIIAMNSKEMMLGVFAIGTRNHCVLIDGSKGLMGKFTDPVKEFGTKDWSKRSLQKLDIEKFDKVYTVKRCELSDKKRKHLHKRSYSSFCQGCSCYLED